MDSNASQERGPNVPVHTCALCMMSYPITDYFTHLVEEHYDIFLSLLATYCPDVESSLFIHLLRRFVSDHFDEDEMDNYEFLLELCNTIGYQSVGVSDLQKVVTECTLSERCPICLDETEKEGYQTNKCHHEFCKDCLIQWTNDHKSCPLCKTELEEAVK